MRLRGYWKVCKRLEVFFCDLEITETDCNRMLTKRLGMVSRVNPQLLDRLAHEYKSETIYAIFEKVLKYTPKLLESVETIVAYAQKHCKKTG